MPRAVRFEQYGGVEVLQLVEVEQPVPGAGELLIEVRAAGLNPFDAKLRKGLMEGQFAFELPAPQGTDVAGVVAALGPEVTQFKPGDEIVATIGTRGAQADFALVKAGRAVLKPAGVSWEVAGGLWGVGTTAYAMVRAAAVADGDVVLVSGASGGVGTLAIQLARRRGATVIGVAGERNHEWLRSHGVLPVTYAEGIRERIEAAAASTGKPVNAVLDVSGGGYVELAIGLGVTPERIDSIADFAAAERYGARTDGSQAASTPEVVAELLGLLAADELELPIHRAFPLEQVQAAYTELEHGHPRGKIVLTSVSLGRRSA